VQPLFPPHRSREQYDPSWTCFRELHLYNGSRCNRACEFCTVAGSPSGWYEPFTPPVLDLALQLVAPDGNLKIYGGEPTLDPANIRESMAYLRAGGFTGWFTLFTNGVLAERLIALLEADDRCEAVLNYSILFGDGAPPLPRRAQRALEEYARGRPGVLFASHPDLVPVGPGATFASHEPRPSFQGTCPRCPPVLTSRGLLHACPFAVELEHEQYRIGGSGLGARGPGRDGPGREPGAGSREPVPDPRAPSPETLSFDRWLRFRDWIGEVITPRAEATGRHPCAVCTGGDFDHGPWAQPRVVRICADAKRKPPRG
jgi:hypothetical protein